LQALSDAIASERAFSFSVTFWNSSVELAMIARRLCLLLLVAWVSGCGGDEPFRKTTSPVKGKITVDGAAPGSEVQLECHSVAGIDTQHPTFSQSSTDAEGNFAISTYAAGDGVPAGEYVLVFTWQDFNVMSRSYSGPDKLKKRYNDPKTSEIKVSVKEGEPLDLGVIALTTK
jgi:hypothetical protein